MTTPTDLLGCPLEPSNNTVLYLIEVLHSLGDVNEQVGPHPLRSKAPNLADLRGIVLILLGQIASTLLGLLTRGHLSLGRGQTGE